MLSLSLLFLFLFYFSYFMRFYRKRNFFTIFSCRFASGNMVEYFLHLAHEVDPNRRKELGHGQHPFAVILTCSDSRVAPELIFVCSFYKIIILFNFLQNLKFNPNIIIINFYKYYKTLVNFGDYFRDIQFCCFYVNIIFLY